MYYRLSLKTLHWSDKKDFEKQNALNFILCLHEKKF